VLEGKGIKLSTAVSVDEASQINNFKPAARAIKESYKMLQDTCLFFLDTHFMENPDNASVVVDVATAYKLRRHPPQSTVVGLWDARYLSNKAALGGFSANTIHHFGMLGHYASMKVNMKKGGGRQELTHIISRMCYLQVYEADRKHKNKREMISDQSAYDNNHTYKTYTERMQNIGKELELLSYGVRDEIRIGIGALDPFIDCIDSLVSALIKTL
jgi:hypothetical protein